MRIFKAKCISTDSNLYCHIQGRNYHNVGEVLEVYERHFYTGRAYYTNNKNGLTLQRDIDGSLFIPGFDNCRFRIVGEKQFTRRNRSAALGQVEIDWTRCKRSIRNQARNILKDMPSSFLERLARK
jgi:hypothetical protein